MLQERIKNYFSRFEKYLFKYKDGFWEFPYVAHNPEAMLAGFDVTPFVKHFKDEQYLTTSTLFMDGEFIYHSVEDGLFFTYADIKYKANVNQRRVTDKNVPSDYYILSLEISKTTAKKTNPLVNGLSYANSSWLLIKPETSNDNCHFKGTHQSSFTIFFSRKFLQEVLNFDEKFKNSVVSDFFNSKLRLLMWPEDEGVAASLSDPIFELISKKKTGVKISTDLLKEHVYVLIYRFLDKYDSDTIGDQFVEISEANRKRIMKAEKLLMDGVGKPFQGVEELAQKTGISVSALKSEFKLVFGKPVYQYFKSRQMTYARQLFQEDNLAVKEVAELLGYQNASKFSSAFNNEFGILPSEIQSNIKTI